MPSTSADSAVSAVVLPAASLSTPLSSFPVDPAITTFIDGLDVTSVVLEGTVTRRLNRPSVATVRIPTEATGDIGVQVGSRLMVIDVDFGMLFHGFILTMSDEGDEDKLYTQLEATDPMELWRWRPARDGVASGDAGDFSKPTFIERNVTGPQMMEEILVQSEDPGGIPLDAEGPLFLEYGTFETGGVDLSGAPVDWPMTIAEIANLLTSTGEVDIVLTPIDSGGNMAEINVYNGDFGTDLSGSLAFEYATGAFNVRLMRRIDDMSTMVNKMVYEIGPKIDDQHWKTNVQGDDPAFNSDGVASGTWATSTGYSVNDVVTNGGRSWIARVTHVSGASTEPGVGAGYPSVWTLWMTPPGGRSSPPASATDNQLGVLRIASQGQYGVRMEIKIFDGDDAIAGLNLYRRLWQLESWLRAQPRSLVHITPIRNTPLNFDIGDLVTVSAGAKLRGGFSGVQRIYEFTVSWDENGVRELSELVTTASQEGI